MNVNEENLMTRNQKDSLPSEGMIKTINLEIDKDRYSYILLESIGSSYSRKFINTLMCKVFLKIKNV